MPGIEGVQGHSTLGGTTSKSGSPLNRVVRRVCVGPMFGQGPFFRCPTYAVRRSGSGCTDHLERHRRNSDDSWCSQKIAAIGARDGAWAARSGFAVRRLFVGRSKHTRTCHRFSGAGGFETVGYCFATPEPQNKDGPQCARFHGVTMCG